VGGEVAGGAAQEGGTGRALFIGMDLGVGKPGVVIDDGVDVVEPDLGADGPMWRPCARQPPPLGIRPIFGGVVDRHRLRRGIHPAATIYSFENDAQYSHHTGGSA